MLVLAYAEELWISFMYFFSMPYCSMLHKVILQLSLI
jgi:hypothetical protein